MKVLLTSKARSTVGDVRAFPPFVDKAWHFSHTSQFIFADSILQLSRCAMALPFIARSLTELRENAGSYLDLHDSCKDVLGTFLLPSLLCFWKITATSFSCENHIDIVLSFLLACFLSSVSIITLSVMEVFPSSQHFPTQLELEFSSSVSILKSRNDWEIDRRHEEGETVNEPLQRSASPPHRVHLLLPSFSSSFPSSASVSHVVKE